MSRKSWVATCFGSSVTSSELAARCERTANVQRATGSEVRPRPRARRYRGERLCCAKIPFSFEVDRYNEQPANNRLTFIYMHCCLRREPPVIVGLEVCGC